MFDEDPESLKSLARKALIEKLHVEQSEEVVELFTEQIKEGIEQSKRMRDL